MSALDSQVQRPNFSNDIYSLLLQAKSIAKLIETASYEFDRTGATGLSGGALAIAGMLDQIGSYVDDNFQIAGAIK